MKRCFSLFCAVFPLVFAGCFKAQPKTQAEIQAQALAQEAEFGRSWIALGTLCTVRLYDTPKTWLYDVIYLRLKEIEELMSPRVDGSDISRINASAGIAPVTVDEEVFDLVERAVHFAEISEGAFDPTIGPLVSLWAIGTNPHVPSQQEIDAVLPLVNWRDIELDREQRAVFLKRKGMALDLGGIAKGYAVEEAGNFVKAAQLKRALINFGGDVFIHGAGQDGGGWKIGVRQPFHGREDSAGIVNVGEGAIVSSGVYERYFESGESRYHHLFSPFNGYPADNGLVSVTIIAKSATDADALSTAVFVLGYEKGRALIDSLDGAEALFIFHDRSIRKTDGIHFELLDKDYTIK